MKFINLLLFTFFSVSVAFGQGTATMSPPANALIDKEFIIQGRLVEAGSGMPIEYATIVAKLKADDALIEGTTSDLGGKFELRTNTAEIYIEISFIGYESITIREFEVTGNNILLGEIKMGTDAKLMDEVVVTAERSSTEFKLDKRVFNVGKDLSSTGASALEVLNNVPSVNVNIEGEISLRGNAGVQVLINGKPSILTNEQGNALGTITADMISQVEVVTNPSAKYEAEGTAGIINIILKKNEKTGLNGSITLNTGIPHNHSLGLSINKRSEKFNIFSQLGVGYRELPRDGENINRDLTTGNEISSISKDFRNENFYNFILGSDYYIDSFNVVTLSGSFAYEIEDQPSTTDFTLRDTDGNIVSEWRRNEVTEATNPKYQYELQYKRDFKDNKKHQFLFSAIGNYFGKDQSSVFTNDATSGSDVYNDQLTNTNFEEGKYTFNVDYTKPFNKYWTMEVGAQYLLNDVSNDFEVKDEINGEFVADPNLTNLFEYNQKVLGLYGTGSYEGAKWGAKIGLRVENTDLTTLLVNTNEDNSQNFTNLFPSLHTSYKVNENISLQAGYSSRIYRPRLWDLNPFFNIRNNFNIRAGNPKLLPEYSDSYEVGSIFIFGKTSFNVSVYHKYTTDVIERVSTFSEGVNTFRPENIGTRNSTGIELNFKYSPFKILTINGDMNYNTFSREGQFNETNFDFQADQWSANLTNKFKINRKLDFEISGRYRSEEQTVQSLISDNLFADLGLRYKILKGKGVFNFSVRDVFASRFRESVTTQEDFYIYSFGQRGRFITMGFSYGFGKGEAMQFSGSRRR